MNERLKPRMRKHNALFSESKKLGFSLVSVFFVFLFVNTFFYPSFYSDSLSIRRNLFDSRENLTFPRKTRVYMHDLPANFTYGIIKQHTLARGGEKSDDGDDGDDTGLKYPIHKHMQEWYLFTDLTLPEIKRVGSPIIRVFDPAEADLFYVSAFSSLSSIVSPGRPGSGSGSGYYSHEEMQESLAGWLESQEVWRRNNGRDHVIVVGDPNALNRVMGRVKNAVLLVTGFNRLRGDQVSLVKDVIIPYVHRIDSYEGELGVIKRNTTLFFFMRNRKDVRFRMISIELDRKTRAVVY